MCQINMPHVQLEKNKWTKCKTIHVKMSFIYENKTRFHINGFAFSFALKQRLGATKYRQFNRPYSRYPPSLHALKD